MPSIPTLELAALWAFIAANKGLAIIKNSAIVRGLFSSLNISKKVGGKSVLATAYDCLLNTLAI